ncbi:hypothetical protein NMG60_11029046 [Bertholletia excelsa]
MAKKSQRRPVRHEKDQAGCIWGFISIFDFRHGRSTRKLLSDRRHPNRQVVGAGHSRSKPFMLAHSIEKSLETNDNEEKDASITDFAKARVKELMEVDMFSEHDQKKLLSVADMEAKESDSEHKGRSGRAKRNRKRNSKTSKSFGDIQFETDTANLGPEKSSKEEEVLKSSNNLDIEVVNELCQKIQQNSNCMKDKSDDTLEMQSEQIYSLFDKKLSEAIKVFVDQRFAEGKHLAEDGKANQSREFIDALQTLSSNKELIVELLKDPNSLLVKYIQDLEDSQLEKDRNSKLLERSNLNMELISASKPSVPNVHKPHNFFRRRSKSQETIQLKEDENCQTSNRIVILKPGPPSTQNSEIKRRLVPPLNLNHKMESKVQNERTASQFSFTEIKRKLRNAMGKEQHGVPSDMIAHRFPLERQNSGNTEKGIGGEKGGWSSPNRDHFYNERFARPAVGIKSKDKSFKPKDTEASIGNGSTESPEQKVTNIYIEAKKHLSEMLSNGDEIEDFSSRQFPLGRILSLPEFNFSPICSPGRDKEHGFVTAKQRISPRDNFHAVNEDSWQPTDGNHVNDLDSSSRNFSQPCIIDSPEDKAQPCHSNSDGLEDSNHANAAERGVCSVGPDLTTSGASDMEIVPQTDDSTQEDSKVLDILPEQCSFSVNVDDQNSGLAGVCDEQESAQCLQLDSSKQDQLLSSPLASPPSFSISEDIGDLKGASERTERPSPVSVLEPLFTEDDISPASVKFQPVEPPIQPLRIPFEEQLSSATSQEICISTCINDEESAFEYVEAVLLASDLRPSHDQKLLFDCTNESIKEICDCYFGFGPWVSFTKHNIRPVPRGKDLIEEIWKRVEWHLLPQPSPRTLDVIIGKDMVRAETWMDLRFDVESIGLEIGRAILEGLVEDTILSFECEDLETASSVLPAKLIEHE